MPSTPFSIQLTDELSESLANFSRLSHRSASQIASKAIAEYVTRHEGKLAAIQAAKAQADQGLFISQDAAIEWLDSWGTDQELDAPEPDVFRKLS